MLTCCDGYKSSSEEPAGIGGYNSTGDFIFFLRAAGRQSVLLVRLPRGGYVFLSLSSLEGNEFSFSAFFLVLRFPLLTFWFLVYDVWFGWCQARSI